MCGAREPARLETTAGSALTWPSRAEWGEEQREKEEEREREERQQRWQRDDYRVASVHA